MIKTRCSAFQCGAIYEVTTNGNGGLVGDCPWCARKKAGICRDCPAPTPSKRHIRCATHGEKRRREAERERDRVRYVEQHDRRLALAASYRAKPGVRERRREAERARRAANPPNDFDRAYYRARRRRQRKDPRYRAKEAARKREERARLRQQRQAVAA